MFPRSENKLGCEITKDAASIIDEVRARVLNGYPICTKKILRFIKKLDLKSTSACIIVSEQIQKQMDMKTKTHIQERGRI